MTVEQWASIKQQLASLPVGSVILGANGVAWLKLDSLKWRSKTYHSSDDPLIQYGPFEVLHQPS